MYNLDIDPFLRSNSCVQVYISLLWLGLIIQTKTRVYLRECQAQLQWPSPPVSLALLIIHWWQLILLSIIMSLKCNFQINWIDCSVDCFSFVPNYLQIFLFSGCFHAILDILSCLFICLLMVLHLFLGETAGCPEKFICCLCSATVKHKKVEVFILSFLVYICWPYFLLNTKYFLFYSRIETVAKTNNLSLK